MGRMYTASFQGVSISVITDLLYISAPSDGVIRIHDCEFGYDETETDEQALLRIFRTATNQDAVGISVTPNPIDGGDATFSGIARRTITAGSLSAVTTPLWEIPGSSRVGWRKLWTPEARPLLTATAGTNGRLVFKFDEAPISSTPMSGYVTLEEIGG